MPYTPQNARPHQPKGAKSSVSSGAVRLPRMGLQQRGASFVLRKRHIILPVILLMLAAIEGTKLLMFGPHPRPTVLILDLVVLGLIMVLVGLLIAALERSEAERARASAQASAAAAERKQVAQNLHDTVAQNISYLRLKLDQLTGENTAQETVTAKDLEQMRAAAEEAYLQLRMMLDELNPLPVQDLAATITKQAGMIAQRAGFDLRTTQIGTIYALPSPTNQQILYIVREALHNIEKHARANCVHVQLVWLEKELIIKITDDGIGMLTEPGSDALPDAVHDESHYGLWIMRHRAAEIGGAVTIQPADVQGTEVTLWLPRQQDNRSAGTKPIARSAGCEY